MLKGLEPKGVAVGCCGTSLDAPRRLELAPVLFGWHDYLGRRRLVLRVARRASHPVQIGASVASGGVGNIGRMAACSSAIERRQ